MLIIHAGLASFLPYLGVDIVCKFVRVKELGCNGITIEDPSFESIDGLEDVSNPNKVFKGDVALIPSVRTAD